MIAPEPDTRQRILAAAKEALLDGGFAQLSTRRIAESAGVPLSQIHYHFGSKRGLVLDVLADENRKLLERQAAMFRSDLPLWQQWERACDFLDDDLESGYVRVLHEMVAAGWSDAEIAEAVRGDLRGWFELLSSVAEGAASLQAGWGPFTSSEVAALVGASFLGAETLTLLGMDTVPSRAALRKVGSVIRSLEEGRHE